MEFSRNRFAKWLLIIAGIFLVTGAGLYIYRSKFSADENINNTDFLADIQDQSNLNDPTVIKLPDKYTKDDIQMAITSQGQVSTQGLSSKNQEINNYIKEKTLEIVKNVPIVKDDKGRVINDLVIKVADSSGGVVTPKAQINTPPIKAVADNFIFDQSVSEKSKKTFIAAYPVIESIYGARSNNEPIKVFYDKDLYRGYYSGNEIHLDVHDPDDEPIHELVHAFHGPLCLDTIWEEGMAEKVTQLVEVKLNMPETVDEIIQEGYILHTGVDNPSVFADPGNSYFPYMYGSSIMNTLYAADSDFFKKFNSYIYLKNSTSITTLAVATYSAVNKVEGESTMLWLSHQYGLFYITANGKNIYPDLFSIQNRGSYIMKFYGGSFELNISSNSYLLSQGDFIVQAYDNKNHLLVDNAQCSTLSKVSTYVNKKCIQTNQAFKDYDGILNIKITSIKDPSNAKTFPYIKRGDSNLDIEWKTDKYNTFYILDLARADYAKVTNISSGENKILKKDHEYFSSKDNWLMDAGNYKVEEYKSLANCSNSDLSKCLGSKIAEKSYYRFQSNMNPYFTVTIPAANQCEGKIDSVTTTNNSAEFKMSTKINCGYVFFLTGVPVARYWGKSFDYVVSSLPKNFTSNFRISFNGDGSVPRTINSKFTTTNTHEFNITKVENRGDPSANNFVRRVSFNSAYNPASVNLSLSLTGKYVSKEPAIQVDIVKVNDKTFDIKPKSKIYNNATYTINGFEEVTDNSNYKINNLNGGYQEFTTNLNPVGGLLPSFRLKNINLALGENPVLVANFDLRHYSTHYINIPIVPQKGNAINSSLSIKGNEISIQPESVLTTGTYTLSTSETFDDKNNYIAGAGFKFSVK